MQDPLDILISDLKEANRRFGDYSQTRLRNLEIIKSYRKLRESMNFEDAIDKLCESVWEYKGGRVLLSRETIHNIVRSQQKYL